MTEISGICPARFAAVRQQFAAHFDQDLELGARFSVCIKGEPVIDLMAGFSDLAKTQAVGPETLFPVFSSTKAVAALMMARAVDAGRIRYDQPVADLWPEFGQAGKGAITVAQLLSHQAGLPGFDEPTDPDLWYDREAVLARLAAQAPMWEPGTASGYHPITVGYMVGELFRRADGRTLGRALREDLAAPFGLDVWIGLPDAEHGRVAQVRKPTALPDLGELTDVRKAAFLNRGASVGRRDAPDWRRAEIPSANGHATSLGLARLMAVVANGGVLDREPVLSPQTVAELTKSRISGPDRVLPFDLSWAAGLLRNDGHAIFGPGRQAVGHYGWGGSVAMADPETGVSASYVMNRQSPHLIGDPRPVALFKALYRSL